MSKKSNKGNKTAVKKKVLVKKKEPIKKKPKAVKKSPVSSKIKSAKKNEPKKAEVNNKPSIKKEVKKITKATNSNKSAKAEKINNNKIENKKNISATAVLDNGSTSIVRPLTEKPTLDKKGKVIQPTTAPIKMFKLRIDSRTIISVKSKEALKMWKDKYPNAVEEE